MKQGDWIHGDRLVRQMASQRKSERGRRILRQLRTFWNMVSRPWGINP
jgi:hypothetical protein